VTLLAVLEELLAVVADHRHHGVVGEPAPLELVDELLEVVIDPADLAVVERHQPLQILARHVGGDGVVEGVVRGVEAGRLGRRDMVS
jgi:hypothetical protein